jgi:hypothetical protein
VHVQPHLPHGHDHSRGTEEVYFGGLIRTGHSGVAVPTTKSHLHVFVLYGRKPDVWEIVVRRFLHSQASGTYISESTEVEEHGTTTGRPTCTTARGEACAPGRTRTTS